MGKIINLDGNPGEPFIKKIDEAKIEFNPKVGSLVLVARDWQSFEIYMRKYSNWKFGTSIYETGPDVYFYWGEYRRRKLFSDEFYEYTNLAQRRWGLKTIGLAAKGPGEILDKVTGGIAGVTKAFEGIEKTKDLSDIISDLRGSNFSCATPSERKQGNLRGKTFKRGDVKKKIFSDLMHAINCTNRFYMALTTCSQDSPILHEEKSKRLLMAIEPPTTFTFGDLLPYI